MSLRVPRRRCHRSFGIAIVLLFILIIIYVYFRPTVVPNHEQSFDCSQLCPYMSNFTRNRLEFDSTYVIRHYPEFVCPQNFRNLADWIYGWPDQFNEHIEETTIDVRRIAPCLPRGSIIYVRSWVLGEFFTNIYPYLINDFVLITGEGDQSSPNNINYLERVDSKIIHWFGQNGQIDRLRSNKFTHIPIGINCYEMAEAIQGVYKQHPHDTLPPIFGDIDEPPHYIQPLDLTRRALNNSGEVWEKLLLLNYDRMTDWTRVRFEVWKSMCYSKNKATFARCIDKEGGVYISEIPEAYARNRQYPFWLSPRGNGLDCHRTWEALYLDVIPIVWNSSLNVLYDNLPVIIIQNYTEITETFLRQKLHEISMKKSQQITTGYQFEKLRNAYWRRLILNQSRYSLTDHNIRRRCWRAKTTIDWLRFVPVWIIKLLRS